MANWCIHIANVLYLFSYLVRDMLWLRILTCLGLALGIVFFACQPSPLYGPSGWHLLFLVINGLQIWRLLIERRRLMLTAKQERVAEATFQDLSREQLLTLLTRSMSNNAGTVRDIHQASSQQLTKEELVLRDIAFSRLSRAELLNLLTRKMWTSIIRLYPARWKRQRRPEGEIAPRRPELNVASDSVMS